MQPQLAPLGPQSALQQRVPFPPVRHRQQLAVLADTVARYERKLTHIIKQTTPRSTEWTGPNSGWFPQPAPPNVRRRAESKEYDIFSSKVKPIPVIVRKAMAKRPITARAVEWECPNCGRQYPSSNVYTDFCEPCALPRKLTTADGLCNRMKLFSICPYGKDCRYFYAGHVEHKLDSSNNADNDDDDSS
jgi:hypothetical protein